MFLSIEQQNFDGVHEIGELFVYLNHPRAIGTISRLRAMDRLIHHIKATPKVWVTNLREVVNWTLKK